MTPQDPLQDVLDQLDQLAPPADLTDATQAWHRFKNETMPSQRPSSAFSLFNVNTWRIPLMTLKSPRLTAGLVLTLLVASLFLLPGTRAAANQFLGIFRVQKFAPISVSPETLSQLQNMELDGLYPGEIVWSREPQDPQTVTSYDEAAATANYDNWVLMLDDQLGPPTDIAASSGGAAVLTVDLAASRAILDAAGVDPTLLPENLDGADIEVDIPGTILTRWAEQDIVLIQGNSPQVDYPVGFDPAPIGQAMLQLLGMDEVEAYRLSQNIDWTNTLILPIPQEIGTFREVPVLSTTGLLIEALDGSHAAVIWQNSSSIYMLSGPLDGEALLALLPQ